MKADSGKLNNLYNETDIKKIIASKEFYDKVVTNEKEQNEEL